MLSFFSPILSNIPLKIYNFEPMGIILDKQKNHGIMTHQQENKRLRSRHLFSPDVSTTDCKSGVVSIEIMI